MRALSRQPAARDATDEDGVFDDDVVDGRSRYSVGTVRGTGQHYVAVPARSELVDFEEHYEIDAATYERFCRDVAAALAFTDLCWAGLMEHRVLPRRGVRQLQAATLGP